MGAAGVWGLYGRFFRVEWAYRYISITIEEYILIHRISNIICLTLSSGRLGAWRKAVARGPGSLSIMSVHAVCAPPGGYLRGKCGLPARLG